MDDYFETWAGELNALLGGGVLRGEGVLIKYEIEGIADGLFVNAAVDILDNMLSAVLVPRRGLTPDDVDEYLDALNASLDPLLDNNQLFVLDVLGDWDERENVFQVTNRADMHEAIRTALDRSHARGTVHMLDVRAIVETLGAEETRRLREWYQTDGLRGKRDYILHGLNVSQVSPELVEFYESTDEQVLSVDRMDGIDRLTVEKAPEGLVGETRTIEYLSEHPFVRFN